MKGQGAPAQLPYPCFSQPCLQPLLPGIPVGVHSMEPCALAVPGKLRLCLLPPWGAPEEWGQTRLWAQQGAPAFVDSPSGPIRPLQ